MFPGVMKMHNEANLSENDELFLLKTNLIGQMSPIWHLTLLRLLLSESVGTYDKLNIYAKKIFRVIGTSKQNLSQVR